MTVPRWLDRAYTVAVVCAAIIGLPVLTILWVEKYGAVNVALFFLAVFLAGLWRGWPNR